MTATTSTAPTGRSRHLTGLGVVVLVAFNGDTSLPADSRTNKALRVLDGFVKQAQADADVHDFTIPGAPSYNSQVFPAMLQALPKDYRDERDELGFFVSANVYDSYAMEIGSRATALGDMLLAGPWQRNLSYLGYYSQEATWGLIGYRGPFRLGEEAPA